nr:hypothetical protein CFP56_06084 [Quercus suber]
MVTSTMKDDGDRSAVKDAMVMEVEHTLSFEETKPRITPKNPENSVVMVNDVTFQKKVAVIDRESRSNMFTKADISGFEIKAVNSATTDRCLEIRGREDGDGIKRLLKEWRWAPLTWAKIRVGSGSKENEETSSQSNKGSWRRLIRESPITVAMDRDSEVKGQKRKLVVPLGEVDQNVTQGKKVKIDFDEGGLGNRNSFGKGEHYGALPGKLQDSINSMEFESLWPYGEEYRAHARKAIVTRSTSNGTFKPRSDNRDKNGVE